MWEKFIKIDKPVGWNKHECWKIPQNNNPVGWKQLLKINKPVGRNKHVGGNFFSKLISL